MNTPDKIKKALECCTRMNGCIDCPYGGEKCVAEHATATLAYIQQLEAERDETISILRLAGCDTCKYREVGSWEEPCLYCMNRERWEWRGVQKEE